jgi:tetratricopeptide (TPR) repeat protein
MIWQMALDGVKERPVLGWGQDNFIYVFNEFYNPEMFDQEPWFDRAHNAVMDWLVAGGVLGLLSYLALFGAGLYLLWQKNALDRVEKALFSGLLIGYLFHNLFVFDNITSYILFFLVLAYIHQQTVDFRRSGTWWQRVKSKLAAPFHRDSAVLSPVSRYGLPVAAGILAILSLWTSATTYAQGHDVLQGLIDVSQAGDVGAAEQDFKQAIEYGYPGLQEALEQTLIMTSNAKFAEAKADQQKSYTDFAKSIGEEYVDRYPREVRPRLFLAEFYMQTGETKKAIAEYKTALSYSPHKQGILLELGSALLADDQSEEALDAFAEAYRLATRNDQARLYYALALIQSGRSRDVAKILGDVVKPTDQFVRAFAVAKDYKKAEDLLVASDSTNVQLYASLAAALYKDSRISEALKVMDLAIERVPNFKKQGTEIRREMQNGTLVIPE